MSDGYTPEDDFNAVQPSVSSNVRQIVSAKLNDPPKVAGHHLSMFDILRTSTTFLSLGLNNIIFLQSAGIFVRAIVDDGYSWNLDSILLLPCILGVFTSPLVGVLSDKVCNQYNKTFLTVATSLLLLGQYLIGQNFTMESGGISRFGIFIFSLGTVVTRLAGYLLVWENCGHQGEATDKYGSGYSAAALLEVLGMILGHFTISVNWPVQAFVPGCKNQVECQNRRFAFHLVLPIITILSLTLVLLSRSASEQPKPKATAQLANNLSGVQVMSRSGARLTSVLYFFTSSAWQLLFGFLCCYVTQDVYSERYVPRKDLLLFGNPHYQSVQKSKRQESELFTANFWQVFLFGGLITTAIFFISTIRNSGRDTVASSKLYDVTNTFLVATLLLGFIFAYYPYRPLMLVWALMFGLVFGLQLILPFLLVTRYIMTGPGSGIGGTNAQSTSPSRRQRDEDTNKKNTRAGQYLGGLLFFGYLGQAICLKFTPFVHDYFYSTWSLGFLVQGIAVFGFNLLAMRKLVKKEGELYLLKYGVFQDALD